MGPGVRRDDAEMFQFSVDEYLAKLEAEARRLTKPDKPA